MCGRYTHLFTWKQLHRLMGLVAPAPGIAESVREQLPLRYNVAPTQGAPVVYADRAGGERRLDLMEWGLVPAWAKESEGGAGPDVRRPINARSETAATSPMFRGPLRTRRCVVPASGFYEWQALGEKKLKQPWYITPAGDGVFAFAGLWDEWRPRHGAGGHPGESGGARALRTFTILTTDANRAMKPIHDRMPVILPPEGISRWLDPSVEDPEALAPLLAPCAESMLSLRRIGTWVNSPAHDDARCIEGAGEDPKALPHPPNQPGYGVGGAEEPGLFGPT